MRCTEPELERPLEAAAGVAEAGLGTFRAEQADALE